MFTWLKIEAYEKSVKWILQIVKEILIFDIHKMDKNDLTPRNYYC